MARFTRYLLLVSVLTSCPAAVRPVVSAGTTSEVTDWAGWRGPTGMGLTRSKGLPTSWGGPEDTNIAWKAALPASDQESAVDQNQSSPIVSKGRVFVTTSFWKGKQDAANYPEHHLTCFNAEDGKRLWDLRLEPGPWKLSDLRGGYTAPTPAADGERVYVVFGSAVIAAVDYEGKLLWRREIVPHKFDVALGASPVLFGDWVLLQCDQVEGQGRLIAFDRKTGAIAWSRTRPDAGFTHSTPIPFREGDRTTLLAVTSKALQMLNPMNGEVIWSAEAAGDTVSPIYDHGMVYIDSGRGGPGYAVDFTGQEKWISKRIPEAIGSPVSSGDFIYRLHSPGVLDCIRWSNGETVYSERVPGVNPNASLIATGDGLVYLATAGKSCVVRAGEQFEIVGTSDLGDPCAASPAVNGRRLYLKGQRDLYCLSAGAKR